MTVSVRVVLAFLPLAFYCLVMGLWQSRRSPLVVTGSADFSLLSFGLGGLIAFGPVGQFLVSTVFLRPSLSAWVAVASFVALVSMMIAMTTRSRLVVYQVGEDELSGALKTVLDELVGPSARTLQGFEHELSRKGVVVEYGHRLRCAVIQAHGEHPQAFAAAIHARLAERLKDIRVRPNPTAMVWFGLSLMINFGTLMYYKLA